jgi:stearoyl-CoA desaturase (delta-9 desaturase)
MNSIGSIRNYTLQTIFVQYLIAVLAIVLLVTEQNYIWLSVSFCSWFLFYVVGEGIFLHRYFSHQAFECKSWVARVGAIFAALGAFGSPISYRIVHITHHAKSDTDEDPHSPVENFWKAFMGWQLTKHPMKLSLLLGKRFLSDKFYLFIEQHSIKVWWAGILFTLAIDWHLTVFMCLGSSIGMLTTSFTNSAGHLWGSRRFETKDNSRNFAWFSWLCWQGSGALQNNHHAHPSRHHDSHAWYEFDIGKWLIPLIGKV